nr:RNA-dependant RNA polymerase [Betapartitivirus sp.]
MTVSIFSQNTTTQLTMALQPIRDFTHERKVRQNYEMMIYQKYKGQIRDIFQLPETTMVYHSTRNQPLEEARLKYYQSIFDKLMARYKYANVLKREPFEFYGILTKPVPPEWQPVNGIDQLPIFYHKGRDIKADKVPETGFTMHPIIKYLLIQKYPHFYEHVQKWCRPLGTTLATFTDFNREQTPIDPISPERKEQVVRLVTKFLDAKPFPPLHYVDVLYTGMPLKSGTSYFNRHSLKVQAHAKYISHPADYENKPTSKGYVFNAFTTLARIIIHQIKLTGLPGSSPKDPTQQDIDEILEKFSKKHPTMLFTRSHISQICALLKQRPVYAVDDLFLFIECMLTFPLHVQARSMNSSIMYGLETLRGGCAHIDKIAQSYRSYISLDWSSFDQTVPWAIIDTFFEDFLPSLLITDQGYVPTFEYPDTNSGESIMAPKLHNLLTFLKAWFYKMVFISQHGYAYRRTCAGIPSGLLNTQYLDSYCNLFVIIDSLLEFGCTEDEINNLVIYVMGDDNLTLTDWDIARSSKFVTFMETYAAERFHMKLSMKKCKVTDQRQYISILSYTVNFGYPTRDRYKLIAQLCYPERGTVDKFMSSRAIGIAYAACGMDYETYCFCRDVFYSFLPYAEIPSDDDVDRLSAYLPGAFRTLDEYPDFLYELKFPTFEQTRDFSSRWHGPLDTHPKWNNSHFKVPCDHVYENHSTLNDWYEKNPSFI